MVWFKAALGGTCNHLLLFALLLITSIVTPCHLIGRTPNRGRLVLVCYPSGRSHPLERQWDRTLGHSSERYSEAEHHQGRLAFPFHGPNEDFEDGMLAPPSANSTPQTHPP